jgi:hypothetical protein
VSLLEHLVGTNDIVKLSDWQSDHAFRDNLSEICQDGPLRFGIRFMSQMKTSHERVMERNGLSSIRPEALFRDRSLLICLPMRHATKAFPVSLGGLETFPALKASPAKC